MSNKNKKPNQKKKKNPKKLDSVPFKGAKAHQLMNLGWTTKEAILADPAFLEESLKENFGPSYVKVINKKTGLPDIDKSYNMNIDNMLTNKREKRDKIRNKEAVGAKGGGMIGKNKIIKGYKKGGKI